MRTYIEHEAEKLGKIATIAPLLRGALAKSSKIEGRPHRVVLSYSDQSNTQDATLIKGYEDADALLDVVEKIERTGGNAVVIDGVGSFSWHRSQSVRDAHEGWKGFVPDGLEGQIAIVTGGAGGLGLSVAELLRQQGAQVALLDVNEEQVQAAAARLGAIGLVCDVTSAEQVDNSIAKIVAHFGGVDILISNAGAAQSGSLLELDDDKFQNAFALNFWGHHYIARAVVRVMQQQGTGGALVFNVSKQAVNPGPNFGAYGTPKAALMALMRQYAVEHGADGITSNAVNADRIRTGLMTDQMVHERSKARGLTPQQYMRGNLVKREVTGEDVAEAFVHLATARTSTGAVLTVDGGNVAAMVR